MGISSIYASTANNSYDFLISLTAFAAKHGVKKFYFDAGSQAQNHTTELSALDTEGLQALMSSHGANRHLIKTLLYKNKSLRPTHPVFEIRTYMPFAHQALSLAEGRIGLLKTFLRQAEVPRSYRGSELNLILQMATGEFNCLPTFQAGDLLISPQQLNSFQTLPPSQPAPTYRAKDPGFLLAQQAKNILLSALLDRNLRLLWSSAGVAAFSAGISHDQICGGTIVLDLVTFRQNKTSMGPWQR